MKFALLGLQADASSISNDHEPTIKIWRIRDFSCFFKIIPALWGLWKQCDTTPCRLFGRKSVCGQKVADKKNHKFRENQSFASKFRRLMFCFKSKEAASGFQEWIFFSELDSHLPKFCIHKFTGVIFDSCLWHECFLKWLGMPRSAPPLTETLLDPTVLFVKRRFWKFCSNFCLCGCAFLAQTD